MIRRVGELRLPAVALLLAVLACQIAVAPAAAAGGVGDAVAGDVEQQSGAPAENGTGNGSSNATGNASGNATGNESAGAAGGGGPLGGIGVPDPGEMFSGMLESFISDLLASGGDAGAGIFEFFANFAFRLAAPGEAGDPSTWVNPDGGVWGAVDGALLYTNALGVLLLTFAAVGASLKADEYSRRQGWKRCGVAFIALVLGLLIPGMLLHAGNGIVDAVRPQGSEFFSSSAGLGKLAVGIGVGLFIGLVQTSVLGIGLFVLAFERVVVYMAVFLWPLAVACYAYTGFVRSLGQTVLYTFGVVIFLKVSQALFLRLFFEIPLVTGDASALAGLVLQIGGLAFALVYWPKTMFDHANDAASVSLGMSGATEKGGEAIGQASGAAYQTVREQYDSYRGGGDTPAESTTVGQVGTGGGSAAGSTASGSTGGVSVDTDAAGAHPSSDSAGATTDGAGGMDANEWDRHRERFDYDKRGFQ